MKYILKNLFLFFISTIFIFVIVRIIPVSPVEMLLAHYNLPMTHENIAMLTHQFGLDKNIVLQYFLWLGNILRGNFGYTYASHISIGKEFLKKLPYSIIIGLLSMILAIVISFFVGLCASLYPKIDKLTKIFSIFTLSFPNFILALFIIYYLGVKIHIISFFGGGIFWNIFFAVLIMTLYQCGSLIRIANASFNKLKSETFIKFYIVRGYNLKYIFTRHAYKPILYSILSASLSKFSSVIGGGIVLEFVFVIPGISYFLITSIVARDYNVIQAYLIILFVWIFAVHLVIDFILGKLRSRI